MEGMESRPPYELREVEGVETRDEVQELDIARSERDDADENEDETWRKDRDEG